MEAYPLSIFAVRISVAHNADGTVVFIGVVNKKRNTPNGAKPHESVDYAAEYARLSAANPCNEVKLKNAYRAPVDAADYE